MSVRFAKQEDLHKAFELTKAGIEETLGFYYPVEDDVLMDSIQKSWYVAPCFIIEQGGEIIGCSSMDIGSFPWNRKPFIFSNGVYVLPKYRSFGIIKELYDEIKKYASLQGLMYMDSFSGTENIDARLRLARSQGLKNTGITVIYNGEN